MGRCVFVSGPPGEETVQLLDKTRDCLGLARPRGFASPPPVRFPPSASPSASPPPIWTVIPRPLSSAGSGGSPLPILPRARHADPTTWPDENRIAPLHSTQGMV